MKNGYLKCIHGTFIISPGHVKECIGERDYYLY